MNFLQLAQRLRQETGTAGSGPTTVASQTGEYRRLVDWVNAAYAEIQNKWMDWRFLWAESTVSLVISTRDYTLESECVMPNEDSFYLGDIKLEPVSFDDYRRDRPAYDDMTPGDPTHFTILPNEQIRVFPTPAASGATIAYEYQRGGLQLVVNDETPVIPPRYHLAILYRAKMLWAEFENAQLEVAAAAQSYGVWMLALEANQLPSREFAHGRVEGSDIVVRAE